MPEGGVFYNFYKYFGQNEGDSNIANRCVSECWADLLCDIAQIGALHRCLTMKSARAQETNVGQS